MEVNSIKYIDGLVGMNDLPNKSVDMILCDLPYGTTACRWDVIIPFAPLWEQYERIIKDNSAIVLTATQPFTSTLVMSNLNLFKYEWIWDKVTHSNPFVAKYRPLIVHENILIFGKGKLKYNPQKEWNGIIEKGVKKNGKNLRDLFPGKEKTYIRDSTGFRNPMSIIKMHRGSINLKNSDREKESLHPTQKPVSLFEYLIKTYTNEGDTVLDNCMGSGTTAIACINTNRNYLGFENDKKYYDISQERIKNHTKPIVNDNDNLFG